MALQRRRRRSTNKAPGRETILIVEDDADTRALFVIAVDSLGLHAVPASDGAEALRMLGDGLRPAAIVLDIAMPLVDGFEFRVRQRLCEELASIPTIVASANPLSEHAIADLAPSAMLGKPFRLRDLKDALVSVLEAAPR